MKKIMCFFSVLILIVFAGCGSNGSSTPLTICVDLCGVDSDKTADVQAAFERFVSNAEAEGGPHDVVIEVIPGDGSERDAAIDRIRTEIAAGGGPDLFIVNSGSTNPLFRFPHTIMKQNYLLPLDEYIQDAKYMEWDQLNQTVMGVGTYDGKQMLIPLGYSFPVTLYKKSDVTHDYSREITWQDVMEDDTGILAGAAYDTQGAFGYHYSLFVSNVFGPLADFSTEELLFSEAELKEKIMELIELKHRDYSSLPSHLRVNIGVLQGNLNDTSVPGYTERMSETEPLTMVPMYQQDGGITAIVQSYAGINRNTKNPSEAFFFLDRLLGKDAQQYSDVYNYITNYVALPTNNSLLSPDTPVLRWNWSEENYQELCKVRDQITCVRFHGTLENSIAELYGECEWLYSNQEEKKIDDTIKETYRVMSMELKES